MAEDFIETQLDRIEGKVDQLLGRGGDTPAPPTTTTPTPTPSSGKFPSQVLPVLRWWTIMLPTGSNFDPDNGYLVDKSVPDTYYVNDKGEVVFEAPAEGVHSENSKYARSEGRQMLPGKPWAKSSWTSVQANRLRAELAIDLLTLDNRPRINGLQIHDGGDDVMQVQAREDGSLGISHNDGKSWEVLDPSYPRGGAFFVADIAVANNKITVAYARGPVTKTVTIPKTGSGWYWKAGAYINTGGASEFRNKPGARGRVTFRSLLVDPA